MPAPAAVQRRRGSATTGLKLLLIVGFVLGAAATVLVVVFADDERWLRIGVLLALWAALLAAFAVARSRREAQTVASREEEITRTYQLELQREVSARREYEVALAERVRQDVERKQNEEIVALREQLERLTDTLSTLLDGDVLVERLTLSAEATRVRGIGDAARARLAGSRAALDGADGADDDGTGAQVVDALSGGDGSGTEGSVAVDAVDSGSAGSGVVDSVEAEPAADQSPERERPDAPATAWTRRHRRDVVQAAAEVAADLAAADRGETGGWPVPETPVPEEGPAASEAVVADTEESPTPQPPSHPDTTAPVDVTAQVADTEAGDTDVAVVGTDVDDSAADDGSRVSAADLLAAFGATTPSRHRRRADDD